MTTVRLGILLRRRPDPLEPFGSASALVRKITRFGNAEGVEVIAFAPSDVDLKSLRVRASRYLGARAGWVTAYEPLPDVVWNRCVKRDHTGLFRWLERRGVQLLNAPALDKWEAHCCLRDGGSGLARHLPETERFTSATVLAAMLERHRTVFIKPVGGAVGRGIIKAEAAGPGVIHLRYISEGTGKPRSELVTTEQLDRWLERSDRASRYIVQQGLELLLWRGRPADVRALVQKDGRGRWLITGMGARVAAPGRFTSNLHTGGEGVAVAELLAAAWPEDVQRQRRVIAGLERLAMGVAHRLDAAAGPLGDLGLDLGIDTHGQIWVIEQNVRPGRTIFELLGCRELFDLAHLRPVQYARHLAGAKVARRARTRST